MDKKLQAKHIPDEAVLEVIDRVVATSTYPANLRDFAALGPEKVIRAKCASMVRRGVITGCTCGCRGSFRRADAPLPDLPTYHHPSEA